MPKTRKSTINPSRPLMTDVHPANSPYNMTDADGLKQWLKAWHENNSTKSIFVAKDEKELTNRTPSILIVNLSTEDKIINAIKIEVDEILAELAEQGGSHPGFKSQPINWDELRLNQVRIVVDPQHRKYYEVLVSGASPICTPLIEHIKENMTFCDVVIKANW